MGRHALRRAVAWGLEEAMEPGTKNQGRRPTGGGASVES